MANDIDLFVDQLLEDAVQRSLHEEDFDPAWSRSECTSLGRRRLLNTCRRMHQMEAQQMRGQPVDQVVLNNARGMCAQLVAAQRFCMGPSGQRQQAHVRSEFRTIPRSSTSSRPDLLPRFPVGPAQAGQPVAQWGYPRNLLEVKHVHLPSFLVGGALDAGRLASRVRAEVIQVRGQLADLQNRGARPEIRGRGVRMLYQLGGLPAHLPNRSSLITQAANIIRQTGRQQGLSIHVVDADRQRLRVMRQAAALGF